MRQHGSLGWSRRALVIVASLLLFGGRAAVAQGAPAARPRNVIFILSDDHRYDAMGFVPGAPDWLETPNLDRMAKQGAWLKNAFVTTSLCSPSRASILTGQYAHRHGVVDNNIDVPAGTHYFPEYLQKAGYRTAFFGKWHMGRSSSEPRPGFDRWVSFQGQGVYHDPVLNVDGHEVKEKGYITKILTDYALDWLKKEQTTEPDKPFFLYLSHKAVHAMFEPAPQDVGKYSHEPVPYPKTMPIDAPGRDTWPEWVRQQRSSWHGVDYMYYGDLDFDTFYRRYAETVLGIDRSVGRVLDYLKQTGLDRNTLVIYMGDNGFQFGEHGLSDKRTAFEASMRVPMLAWAPGMIRPGTVIDDNVLNIDIMPTVLQLAGAHAPRGYVEDGRSFLPLLRGEKVADWRDEFLYEYYWEWNFPQTPTQYALRTARYKYVYDYGVWDRDMLFDLQKDPDEAVNLIGDPAYRDLAARLRARLFAKIRATGGMYIPLREPKGGQQGKRRPPGEPSTDPLLRQGAGG
jgi:N-acetylglucosamine-6-sulfatase